MYVTLYFVTILTTCTCMWTHRMFQLCFLYRSSSSNQAVVVRAKYDFCAERSNELSFSAGDEMVRKP